MAPPSKKDRCCGKCKTPFDVCAKKRACTCHSGNAWLEDYVPDDAPLPEPEAEVVPLFHPRHSLVHDRDRQGRRIVRNPFTRDDTPSGPPRPGNRRPYNPSGDTAA